MKVFIAMDGSHHATKAFDWYMEQMHKEGNEVFLYSHVECPQVPVSALGGLPSLTAAQFDIMLKDHKHRCAQLKKTLKDKCQAIEGNTQVFVETEDGSSGQNIVKKAKELGAEMIITGSRGLGTFRRTILGSVSTYVVHHANVPVLVFQQGQ